MANCDHTAVHPTILDTQCANSEIALVTQGTTLFYVRYHDPALARKCHS